MLGGADPRPHQKSLPAFPLGQEGSPRPFPPVWDVLDPRHQARPGAHPFPFPEGTPVTLNILLFPPAGGTSTKTGMFALPGLLSKESERAAKGDGVPDTLTWKGSGNTERWQGLSRPPLAQTSSEIRDLWDQLLSLPRHPKPVLAWVWMRWERWGRRERSRTGPPCDKHLTSCSEDPPSLRSPPHLVCISLWLSSSPGQPSLLRLSLPPPAPHLGSETRRCQKGLADAKARKCKATASPTGAQVPPRYILRPHSMHPLLLQTRN